MTIMLNFLQYNGLFEIRLTGYTSLPSITASITAAPDFFNVAVWVTFNLRHLPVLHRRDDVLIRTPISGRPATHLISRRQLC